MMWIRISSVILIIATVLVVSSVQTLTNTSTPKDTLSYNIESSENETNLTIQQLADSFLNDSSLYFQKNITLRFASGRHYLVGGVELNNAANVVIIGQSSDSKKPEINCIQKSCFSFYNTSSLHIENIVFTKCYSENSDGGAIFVSEAKTVNITKCLFLGNFVRRRGGAVRIQLIETVHILQSQFIQNSAISLPYYMESIDCTGSSGAISAAMISFFEIKESLFANNTASCQSGAVSVLHSSTRVVNCTFIGNILSLNITVERNSSQYMYYNTYYRPGGTHGGALFIKSGSAQILDGIFTENHVINSQFGYIVYYYFVGECQPAGAACLVSTTTLIIDSTIFANNTAKDIYKTDGALTICQSNSSPADISKSIFQNNFGGAILLYLKFPKVTVLESTLSGDKEVTLTGREPVVSVTGCIFNSVGKAISVHGGVLNVTGCEFNRTFGGVLISYNNRAYFQENYFINNIAVHGSIRIFSGILISVNDKFIGNKAMAGPGVVSASRSYVSCTGCIYSENLGSKGGAIFAYGSNVSITNCKFSKNTAVRTIYSNYRYDDGKIVLLSRNGGAISTLNSNVSITGCVFSNNSANSGNGGAISTLNSNVSSTDCVFSNNSANSGNGGAISTLNSNVSSTDCVFSNNSANSGNGGAISTLNSNVSSTDCVFSNNSANSGNGGAISTLNSNVSSTDCVFSNNSANSGNGGAISTLNSNVSSTDCVFSNNSAHSGNGGALSTLNSNVSSTSCKFLANSGSGTGGAISSLNSNVSSTACVFSNNRANLISGGIIFVSGGSIHSFNSSHTTASEIRGALVLVTDSKISSNGDSFHNYNSIGRNNQMLKNDYAHTIQLTNVHGNCSNLTFSNNIGSIYLLYSTLNFTGNSVFTGNTGTAGGALTLVQSTATFEESSVISIVGNNATYGGGILLSQSRLNVYTHMLRIKSNAAAISGGGIYGYQSDITIQTPKQLMYLAADNRAMEGGAMIAIATNLNIYYGFVFFLKNKAIKGGAIALYEGSKIYIQKTAAESSYGDNIRIKLFFENNLAEYGGALYVDDNTNSGVLCDQSNRNLVQAITTKECFIQTLRLYHTQTSSHSLLNYINVFFRWNTGIKLGSNIYGGLLDRCQVNALAEIHNFDIAGQITGINYLKATAIFPIHEQIDYYKLIFPYYDYYRMINTITEEHLKGVISSDPVRFCFCVNDTYDCSYQWPTVSVRCGEAFSVRAVTVDQVENPVIGTILATTLSSGTSLKTGQSQQFTTGTCTELIYNVFSTEVKTTIELYPDGSCGSTGISSHKVAIIFSECKCPSGLQPAPLANECKCECNHSLHAYVSNCQLNNHFIAVTRNNKDFWIQYHVANQSNTGFLIQTCPYDYCMDNFVAISMNLPLNVDKQCAYNRSGIMCGECEEGLSLVFGSSRCVQCNNNHLALLIAFAIAGIALVTFILIFNMTVAVGTIHGLILYANIVGANSSIFLPPETALRFFISWVNLDLGFEVCFYNGMDSSTKAWLQFVFPAYIISLSILIITVSNYWSWFAGLIGRKNPVATLCTLFLLSYSKLLRTTIASLQFTRLKYPDGSINILWLFNPNIPYFTPNRIPVFIIAIIIIALGTVYTILLFFGQWLRKMERNNFTRCLQSNKYNAFIDAHHAPFAIKYRFWVGILLLARLVHHVLSAVMEDSTHLLIVSGLMCALFILKQLLNEVYQNWLINFMETSFLINLLLFSVSTYYVSNNGDQVALANTSVAIIFITFIGIAFYHTHTYIFKNFDTYQKLIAGVKKCLQFTKQKIIQNANTSVTTKNTSEGVEADSHSLSMNTLREPALDIIAPVSAEDYTPHSVASSEGLCSNTKTPTSTIITI